MESSLPVTNATWRSKSRTAHNTSKSSLLMGFLSCLAWLYVAGRLWQDAQTRTLLAGLLKKSSGQRPKVLTMEDKLVVLGCMGLERRIVDTKMELTLAKSQGYLKNQMQQSGSSSSKRILAVIGVYTGLGGRLRHNTIRGSWMSQADVLKNLEERGIIVRFVIGRSFYEGKSFEERPSDTYGLIEILQSHRGKEGAYMGCMKSGEVVVDVGRAWYKPEWRKFGDQKSYFRHAAGSIFILSKDLARYAYVNSASLKAYAHDDVSLGSWMLTYIDDSRLCCSYAEQDKPRCASRLEIWSWRGLL